MSDPDFFRNNEVLVFRKLPENRADTRVSILNVKNRILAGVGLGQIEIEVEMAINASRKKEKAGYIWTDPIDDFVKSNICSGSLGHLNFLVVFEQTHNLGNHPIQ